MKKSNITVTDLFCGAGGSSIGAQKAITKHGGEIVLALNHWKLAIETHNTNFPNTLHECTDISAVDPRRYPSTNIFIGSPECTNHSLAKGVSRVKAQMDLFKSGKIDASAERSRATMWDVPRFAEYHNYEIMIIENVPDAKKWVLFDPWLSAMHNLGYNHRCVYLNSMFFYPTPQSRDRMYVVFWKKGNKAPKLDFMPNAYCEKCAKNISALQVWKKADNKSGVYGKRGQYLYHCPECSSVVSPYYYAAYNCINWSNLGRKISDRKKPLSDNTMRRIKFGLEKYKNNSFILDSKQTSGVDCRVRNISDRLPTVTTEHAIGIVNPFIIQAEHSLSNNAISASEPLMTQTTRQSKAIIIPWIIEMNKTGEMKPATNPTSTITAGGINHAILIQNKGQSTGHPVTSPAGSVTTIPSLGLLSYNYNGNQVSHPSEPVDAVTTKDRISLITAMENPNIEDCFYRMLLPPEIQLAMAFDEDYVILGSGKEKVKQLGNAVTPPPMTWLVEQCVESLL